MTIAQALLDLDEQRDLLATNLTTMGVTASNTETLAQLIPKVLDITGGGGMTLTTTRVRRTSNYTFASNAWWAIPWQAEIYDENSAFDLGSATRITVPTGITKIQLKAYAVYNNSFSAGRYMQIRKNGTTTIQVVIQQSQNESGHIIDSGWIPVTAGDYFEILINVSSDYIGTTLSGLDSNFGGHSWFEMSVIA